MTNLSPLTLFGIGETYHESTDFCCFCYCCWVGRRACFYWTWNWSRHSCRASCRRDCATTGSRGQNTRTLVSSPEKLSLIENTCKKTPNYNICLQSLKSNPGSSGSDVTGLAQIMVRVMKTKASDGLYKIHELQRVNVNVKERKALSSCASKYNAILVADIPQATEALQKGDPKFAEDGANDAANEATYCENGFSGKSPITKQNNDMHDVAAVTAAIVRMLL